MQILNQIYGNFNSGDKKLAVLIDPDKMSSSLTTIIEQANQGNVDFFLVGGSLLSSGNVSKVVHQIKSTSQVPVLLFPGNAMQLCAEADALLFLSLISGRNPEFLIGQHIQAAPAIYQSGIEVIPVSYILIDGGKSTAVHYITQTIPVPRDKPDLALATALAGKYLGHKMIYLEAGSGAQSPVPSKIISEVKKHTLMPLMVGGGISSSKVASEACQAGADIIVIGTAFENHPELLTEIANAIHQIVE